MTISKLYTVLNMYFNKYLPTFKIIAYKITTINLNIGGTSHFRFEHLILNLNVSSPIT